MRAIAYRVRCAAVWILSTTPAAQADVIINPAGASETRVFVGGLDTCKVNPPATTTENALAVAAPFIAMAGGKLVESGAERLGEYIAESIKRDSTSVSMNIQSTFFYRIEKSSRGQWVVRPALDCIVIVRGRAGAFDAHTLAVNAVKMDPRGRFRRVDEHRVIDFPLLRELGLADYPELYLELALRRDDFDSVFRVDPRVVYYRQTSVKSTPEKKIDLNVFLAFSLPGGIDLGVIPFHLAGLQAGVDYPVEKLVFSNPWLAMPPHPKPKSLLSAASAHLMAQVEEVTPVNVAVTVEETGSASQFMTYLGRFLSGNKAEFGKATEESLHEWTHGASATKDEEKKPK